MNYEKIEANGATYTFDYNECVNIDINEDVTEFHFAPYKGERYSGTKYYLRLVKKQFPNIKKIYIEAGVNAIYVSNFMFPNVDEVVSDNVIFKSGKYLIRYGTLMNTFCKNDDEEIDLDGIDTIEKFALEGCRSMKFINGNLKDCHEQAFNGSMVMLKALEGNHMRVVGNVAVNTSTDSDDVIVPDNFYDIDDIHIDSHDCLKDKNLIIHRRNLLHCISSTARIKKLIVQCDVDVFDLCSVINLPHIGEIEVDEHNPYINIYDSVIYTKDGTKVLRCHQSRTGKVVIRDGVKFIDNSAFFGCKQISSVVMPDSVIRIGDSAFSNCENLKYVRYSNNVDYIPSSCFSGCRNLETFDYNGHLKLIRSGAFSYCMKLNTIFNLEHCSLIDDLAFNQCRNVNEFHIPKTTVVNSFSLSSATKIYLEHESQFNEKFIDAVGICIVSYDNVYYSDYMRDDLVVNVIIGDRSICVPRCMTKNSFAKFNDELVNVIRDENKEFEFFKNINSKDVRQKLIYKAYQMKRSEVYESYMKRIAKSFFENMLSDENIAEDKVVKFLYYDLLSVKALEEFLPTIQERNLNIAAAYILDKKDKKNAAKHSLKL